MPRSPDNNTDANDSNRDSIFASPLGEVDTFRFDQRVVDVFPDMLRRSVPGYRSIISQSGLLAARFARAGTRLYDLGSSLGATSLSMRHALQLATRGGRHFDGCEIHAIDSSSAMIAQASRIIERDGPGIPVQLHCADIQDTPLANASVVAMNFTLQFIEPALRADIVQRIADSLVSGGAFILSEKVTFDDPHLSRLHIDMYHDFKRANGYSDLEISQKREALENVLIPETLSAHQQRLDNAGFGSSSVWFQCFNFASLVAIKP